MWKDVPYVVLLILIGIALLFLHFPAEGAELGSGARASLAVETGYTTNGTDSAIGEPDVFVHHVETLEIASENGDTALRGTLSVEEMRFLVQDIENDQSLSVGFALGQRLTPDLLLRGSVSAVVANTGDDWNLAGFYIATRTQSLALDGMVEAVYAREASEITLRLDAGAHRYGDASFPGLPVDPLKIQADDTSYGFELAARQGLGPLTALAVVEGQAVGIPIADQLNLGRLPASKLRGSLGAEATFGGFLISGEAGAVVTQADDRQIKSPYLRARFVASLSESLAIEGLAENNVELVDNLDAVGSVDRNLLLVASVALTPEIRARLSAERTEREGLFDPSMASRETVFGVGVEHRVSPLFAYNARIARTFHEGGAETYEKTEFVVGMKGSI